MKKLLLTGLFLFSIALCNGQDITLQRNHRTAKILSKYDCSFYMMPVSNDSIKKKSLIYFGQVISYKDSILMIKATECNTKTEFRNGQTTIDYDLFENKDTVINLNVNEIKNIETFREWFYVSSFIGYAGLVSALITTPLALIDYKEKSSNSRKFVNLSEYSLLTSGVCLTIAYTFGRKNYYLNDKKKNRRWHILS